MKEDLHVSAEWEDEWETAYDLAKNINGRYNRNDRHLTCIKILINPDQKTANILVGYEDVSRLRDTGPEDTMPTLCEVPVTWPTSERDESWDDPLNPFKYPKAQLMRGYLLSGHLNTQYLIYSTSNNLRALVKDGEPIIEKILDKPKMEMNT